MKITRIVQQQKRTDRYSIFIDDVYALSLSQTALLTSKITANQLLNLKELGELKQLASSDTIQAQAIRYATMRTRSRWEVSQYLKRKQVSPALIDNILSKLSNNAIIDDEKYARAYIHDRQLLRPTSLRKIIFELRKKHVAAEIIETAIAEGDNDQRALQELIARKRTQSRYSDELKLMQYLARQGFHYGDIKVALTSEETKS